jgi:hypothetical protein
MASATSTDDDALHETAAAPCGFASLPRDVISTHILRSDFLPEPGDLGRLRAVSKSMRDAVKETRREIKKLSDEDAAELGYVSLLKDRHSRGLLEDENLVCAAAARNGDLQELEALRADEWPWDERTCSYAARGGHLEMLKWVRDNGCPWDGERYSRAKLGGHYRWDGETCSCAALGGHLEVLKWARENGCPWSELT